MHITQTITIEFDIDFEQVAREHNITPQSDDDALYDALDDEMSGYDDLEYYGYDRKDLRQKFREWLEANA
jgi:hypothetical protein